MLDDDGRPYAPRPPRHGAPPTTPVDCEAAPVPLLSEVLAEKETQCPPCGTGTLSSFIEAADSAPWRDAATQNFHTAAALESRRDALLRVLEMRPRDAGTERIRKKLTVLRKAVAQDAKRFLAKQLTLVDDNDHDLVTVGSRARHALYDLRLVRMALSRLGVAVDSSDDDEPPPPPPLTTKRLRSPRSPTGPFPKRFLADAYFAADKAMQLHKGEDEFAESVVAIQTLLDGADDGSGDLFDFARDTLFDLVVRNGEPLRRPPWEPVPDSWPLVETPPAGLVSTA